MKKIIFIFLILIMSACSTFQKKSWVEESDEISKKYTIEYSELYPELGSSLGFQKFDKRGMNPNESLEKKEISFLNIWNQKLLRLKEETQSKELKVDLSILLENVKQELSWRNLDEELGVIPFHEASKDVYNFLIQLINAQSSEKRRKDAVDRFKFYMSEYKKKSLIEAYRDKIKRHEEKFKKRNKFYPFKGKIEKYLEDSPTYVVGIKGLLEKTGRSDWKEEYSKFKNQIISYDNYIKSSLLPKARKSPTYPKKMYELVLKQTGVDVKPEELIKIGKKDYKKVYSEFRSLAQKIADKNKLEKSNPADVIQFLKKNQVASLNEVSVLYHSSSDRLEKIIEENHLVTLPEKKLLIRLAGDAESKANPIPHLTPPPLIDNDGVRPEFVVPTSSTGSLSFDDFSFKSAATILTAHEGRPGHDLQFSKMLENPISIIRSRYAMNSVNVEGWALYAEDLVFPYLEDEEKLVAFQTRLWRIARYFLDPEVQLGISGKERVNKIFITELGVSEVMAGLEYQRYAYRAPGQATAYYHGLLNIFKLKNDINKEYGPMKDKCFNDVFLSFGLMPHKEIRHFKEEFKKCKM